MILTLLTLCLPGALQPQGPGTPLVLPMQHLVLPAPAVATPPWGTLLQRDNDPHVIDMLAAEDSTLFPTNIDQMMTLLRDLSSAALEANKLTLQVAGTSLLVGGEAAEIDKVGAAFRHASKVMAQSLLVEVAVWDAADRETPKTVLGIEEFQQFIGNRQPLWRCVATTRPAQLADLNQMRWSRYVRDIDVEVAQKQSMSRPVTDHHGEGIAAVVRACPLVGSRDLVLHVQFALAQRRGVLRPVATGQANAPDIELPTLETAFGAFSGRIPDGGALCATLRGHASGGGQHIVTVRVHSRAIAGNAEPSGFVVLPVAALTSEGLARRLHCGNNFAEDSSEGESFQGSGAMPLDSLLDLVRAGLGDAGEHVTLEPTAGFLLVRGREADLRVVATIVQGLQERLLRPITVLHTGTLRVPDSDSARATGTAPILHELTLPSLAGRELTMVRCLETPVLSDVGIAIAQEAAILDPIVTLLQSGCFLRSRVSPYDDAMHAQTVVVNLHAPMPLARAVVPGGVLMAEEASQVRAAHDGIVTNAQLVEHGDGPSVTIDGRSCRSVLTTLVRW